MRSRRRRSLRRSGPKREGKRKQPQVLRLRLALCAPNFAQDDSISPHLEIFAQGLEDEVGDGGGEDGDGEVGDGEDVAEGDGEGFSVAGGAVELSHEEVGVEEEDDEGDLDERAQDVAEGTRGVWGRGHGSILLRMNSIEDKRVPLTHSHSATNAEWTGHPKPALAS